MQADLEVTAVSGSATACSSNSGARDWLSDEGILEVVTQISVNLSCGKSILRDAKVTRVARGMESDLALDDFDSHIIKHAGSVVAIRSATAEPVGVKDQLFRGRYGTY